jgi:hypothetical protein
MTSIAVELDQRLRALDSETAASVEKLVRDALSLAEKSRNPENSWPSGFGREFGTIGVMSFRTPSPGQLEVRGEW